MSCGGVAISNDGVRVFDSEAQNKSRGGVEDGEGKTGEGETEPRVLDETAITQQANSGLRKDSFKEVPTNREERVKSEGKRRGRCQNAIPKN